LQRISEPEFLTHVNEVGDYLVDRLSEINSPIIKEVRGKGLMVALELTVDVSNIIDKGYEQSLLLVNAGTNVIRLIPPLIIEKSNVDNLVEKLTTIFSTT
jgi:acetylornithine/N-succinyldiaminopimelate aminotransferase